MSDNVQVRDVASTDEKKLSFTKSFTVEYTDPVTNDRLIGTFTAKRPTIGDLSLYGQIKARLNGEMRAMDAGIAWINEMVALCQVCVTEAPKWWVPSDLYDEELLRAVYDHVRSFQDSFRNRRMEQQRGAAADGGSPTP